MDERGSILIVDDERFNINVLVDLLDAEYDTMVAKNGKQALKRAFSANPPDIILLDIMMPDMDGYEVCRTLKEDAKTENIPIIFISALNQVGDEERGLELGAVDFITKPISPSLVKLRVRNHLKMKQQSDLLRDLASLDGLTGIPNRRRFDKMLAQLWQSAIRAESPLSLIMMDIDFFKPYNDNYGHAAGDECLKQVASALAGAVSRSNDLVARYGGEEFVCLLPDVDLQGLKRIGENLRAAVFGLAVPHAHSVAAGCVTISLGGASIIPTRYDDPLQLMKKADENLYRAKETGRNRIEI